MEEWNRYWTNEEFRKCELCNRRDGTLKHLVDECDRLQRTACSEEQIVEGRTDEKVVKWLREAEK